MEYVENVMNLAQDSNGVDLVMLNDLRKILKIGLVEIKILTILYSIRNLMLRIGEIVLNGYLLKIFKMLLILPEVVLVKFIQHIGLKEIFGIGILKIKHGTDILIEKLH
jgi:hypothetical protein